MKKHQNDYVELFCEKKRTEKSLREIQKKMNKFLIDEEEFIKKAKKQLTEEELNIAIAYNINGKTIQYISNEKSNSYRAVRNDLISANEKLDMIATFLDE